MKNDDHCQPEFVLHLNFSNHQNRITLIDKHITNKHLNEPWRLANTADACLEQSHTRLEGEFKDKLLTWALIPNKKTE